MLKTSKITLGYDNKSILNYDGIELTQGDKLLITGESGCGKTTLLYAIAGLIDVLKGNIIINNTNINQLTEAQRDHFRGEHIGIIFQTLHLVKSLTVLDNILLASYVVNKKQDRKRALELLESLHIANKADALPHKLSQGQAQRVAIARAVFHKPSLILADEPTSSLDDKSCIAVIDLLKNVASQNNATLVISTHDKRVQEHFDHVLDLGGLSS